MTGFLKANYHAHTTRCQHAYGTEREFIETAIELGMETFGFSDHVPCPYRDGYVSHIRMGMEQAQEYRDCLRALQKEYAGQIRILAGFEAEYIPEFFDEQMEMFDRLGFDYLILGQHFFGTEITGPYTGSPTSDDVRMRQYVDLIIDAARTGRFLYIAHPDIINYNGLDSVYEWEMTRMCRALQELDIPLEINMLGMGANKIYPSRRLFQIAGEIGNRVVIGIDAHCVDHILDTDSYYRCLDFAEECHVNLVKDNFLI